LPTKAGLLNGGGHESARAASKTAINAARCIVLVVVVEVVLDSLNVDCRREVWFERVEGWWGVDVEGRVWKMRRGRGGADYIPCGRDREGANVLVQHRQAGMT